MKRTLLLFAMAALMFSCAENKGEKSAEPQNEPTAVHTYESGSILPIAVINYDTLMANYDLALEANEALIKKQQDVRLDLNQRMRQLENEAAEFQNKLENNAFLSRERAENEQRRILQKNQDLQALQEQKAIEIQNEQQKTGERLRDSLNSVLAEINRTGKYHLILTTNAFNENVLFAAPQYDITMEVVDMLNDRYSKK